MIEVEASFGEFVCAREGVKFGEALIADQMRPQPAVRGPERLIDEDCHDLIVERATPASAFAERGGIR